MLDNKPQGGEFYGQRREEGTEDELILLFPCKKSLGKTRTVGSCNGRNIIVWRKAYRRTIDKGWDTLTNKIWLYLHALKHIICVGKLNVDDLLCIRKRDDGCFCSKNCGSGHNCIVCKVKHIGRSRWYQGRSRRGRAVIVHGYNSSRRIHKWRWRNRRVAAGKKLQQIL